MKRFIFLIFLLGLLLLHPLPVLSAVLFSEDFNTGSSPYGFEGEHNNKCTTYPDWNSCGYPNHRAVEHLPAGGWNGTGGARFIFRQGMEQDEMGWYNGIFDLKNWQQGDEFYMRFRIKFDSTMRWDGTGAQSNKMFIWGSGNYGGWNHRIMLFQRQDHPTVPCSDMAPQYSNSDYGLFTVGRNIQEYCTPPVPVTYYTWYHT